MTLKQNMQEEIICCCSGTRVEAIKQLIDDGIDNFDRISRITGACSGCGSCESDVMALLKEYSQSNCV